MTTTIKVALTLVYEDATTRTLTFNGVASNVLTSIKGKVKAINIGLLGGTMPAVATTFVSKTGANVTMIRDAKIITTQEEEIYHAS